MIRVVSTDIIVSYDGTPNDDDALALGRQLRRAGLSLALAYVRHSREYDPEREELAAHDAQRRLDQGAAWLGEESLPRHVVVHPSTWEGLAGLARELQAAAVVFGSDYRTPPGHVSPGTTAQHLLEGGPVAVAVAPAGIRAHSETELRTVAVGLGASDGDDAAARTGAALAERLGGEVVVDGDAADLLVLGSAAGTTPGRVALSGSARKGLSSTRAAVLVVPAGTPLLA